MEEKRNKGHQRREKTRARVGRQEEEEEKKGRGKRQARGKRKREEAGGGSELVGFDRVRKISVPQGSGHVRAR